MLCYILTLNKKARCKRVAISVDKGKAATPRYTRFYAPRDDSQGALRFAPVCPSVCLSVRPSVRHALRYRVCVINSSHSFLWIFLKPCIPVVDILKFCMWVFGGARINCDRITAFELSHFRQLFAL